MRDLKNAAFEEVLNISQNQRTNQSGTGSEPPSAKGWQEAIRFNAKYQPFTKPCLFRASSAYCEQLGLYLQTGAFQENKNLYAWIKPLETFTKTARKRLHSLLICLLINFGIEIHFYKKVKIIPCDSISLRNFWAASLVGKAWLVSTL